MHVSLDLRKQVAVLLSFAARTRGTIRTLRGGLVYSRQIWLLMVAWKVVVYRSPRLRDDSKKDQRELIKVCAVILIPYETAPTYGARPNFHKVKWDEEGT